MRNRCVVTVDSDKIFAKRVANLLKSPLVIAQTQLFSAGEHQLVCMVEPAKEFVIAANVRESPSSCFELLLLAQSLKEQHPSSKLILLAPWIAYGRQDRMAKPGEAAGGRVVGKVLSQAFDHIYTFDAHSERFIQGFKGCLTNIYADSKPFKRLQKIDVVVAPDKGAQARASLVAKAYKKPCLFIDKKREGTTVTCCLSTKMDLKGMTALIVDDMADSGGTLVTAATVLRESGAKAVHAFIPHAINLKKLKERSQEVLTHVETAFDHATNKIEETHINLLVKTYQSSK